jgi:hypothetical protein
MNAEAYWLEESTRASPRCQQSRQDAMIVRAKDCACMTTGQVTSQSATATLNRVATPFRNVLHVRWL